MNINQIGQKKKRQAVRRLSQSTPAGQSNRKEDMRRKLEASSRLARGGKRTFYRNEQVQESSRGDNLRPYRHTRGKIRSEMRRHVSPLVNTTISSVQEASSSIAKISHITSTSVSKPVSEVTDKEKNTFRSNLFRKRSKETVFVGSPFNTIEKDVGLKSSEPKQEPPNVFGAFIASTTQDKTTQHKRVSNDDGISNDGIKNSQIRLSTKGENVFMTTPQEKLTTNVFGVIKPHEAISPKKSNLLTSQQNNTKDIFPGPLINSSTIVSKAAVATFEKRISQPSDAVSSRKGNIFGSTIYPEVSEPFKTENVAFPNQQQIVNTDNIFSQTKPTNPVFASQTTTTFKGSVFGSAALPTTSTITTAGTATLIFPTSSTISQPSVFGGAAVPSSSTGIPITSTNIMLTASKEPVLAPSSITLSTIPTTSLFSTTKTANPATQGNIFGNKTSSTSFTDQQTSSASSEFTSQLLTTSHGNVFGNVSSSSDTVTHTENPSNIPKFSTLSSSMPSDIFGVIRPHDSQKIVPFSVNILANNSPLDKISVPTSHTCTSPPNITSQSASLLSGVMASSTSSFATGRTESIPGVQLQQTGTERIFSAGKGPSPKSVEGRKRRISSSSMDTSKLTTIVIFGLTKDYFNKASLTTSLSKFGEVRKVSLQPAKRQVIITFDSHESAKKAKSRALELFPLEDIGIFWCKTKQLNTGGISTSQTGHEALSEKNKKEIHLRKMCISNALRSIDPNTFPSSQTAQERFAVLEEVDKIIRQAIKPYTDLATAPTIIGVCPDMCPEKERYMREDRMNLSVFEMVPGTQDNRDGEVPKVDHRRAVKEYSRSAADKLEPLPHEMRPINVLQTTMDYLAANVMDNGEGRWGEWFNFLWDRTRAIRKDITQQHLCNVECADLVEKITRFHIFCAHYLCEEDMHTFDTKINNENLTKCLQTLKQIYEDLYHDKNIACSKESEFRAYDILLNLNEGDTLRKAMQYRPEIRNSVEVKFALEVFSSLNSNNYVRFFKLLKSASYLNACVMHRYFTQMRSNALETMTKAYRPQEPYPLQGFLDILAFDNIGEVEEFCVHYGLLVTNDAAHFSKSPFAHPERVFQLQRARNVIEIKRNCSIGEVVSGCSLKPLPNPEPMDSFDSNGRYIGLAKLSQLLGGEDTLQPDTPDTPDYYYELDGSSSFSENQPVEATQGVDTVDNLQQELFTQVIQNFSETLVEETVNDFVKIICDAALYEAQQKLGISIKYREKILKENVEVFLREIVTQCIEEERKLKKEKIAILQSRNRVSAIILLELVNDFMSTEVMAVVKDTRREVERKMKAQSFIKMSSVVMNELTQKVVLDQCHHIAYNAKKEMVKEKKEMLQKLAKTLFRSQRKRYFQRWCKQYKTAVHIRDILLHIPALPPILTLQEQVEKLFNHESFADAKGSLSSRSSFSSLVVERNELQEQFKEMVKKKELRRTRAQEPVDVLKAFSFLENNNCDADWAKKENRNRSFKLVISFPGQNNCGGLSIVEEVIKCKFSKVTERDEPRSIPTALTNKIEALSCYTLKAKETLRNIRQLQIDIKASFGVLSEDKLLLVQDNHLFLGLTGILLVLNSTSKNKDEMFWTSSRTRLREIVRSKPRVPAIPLVILHFYKQDQADEGIIKEQLNLDYLVDKGCISKWVVHQRHERIDTDELHDQLVECLQWLAYHCPSTPTLKCKSLKSFVENEVLKLFTMPLCEEITLRKDTQLQPQCPEAIIELYNSVIDHIIAVVTSTALQDISWPIPEFVHSSAEDFPPVSWNSPEHFHDLQNTLQKLKLPPPPSLAQDGTWKSEYTLCLDYVNQLLSKEPFEKFGYYLVTRVKTILNQCKATKEIQTLTAADVRWPEVIQICVHTLLSWLQSLVHLSTDNLYFFEEDLASFVEPDLWRAAVMESLKLAKEATTRRKKDRLSNKTRNLSVGFELDSARAKCFPDNLQTTILTSSSDDIEQKARLFDEKLYMEKRSCESFERQLNSLLSEGLNDELIINEQGIKRKCNPAWTSKPEKAFMRTSNMKLDIPETPNLNSRLDFFETSLVSFQDQLKFHRRAEEFTERQLKETIKYYCP